MSKKYVEIDDSVFQHKVRKLAEKWKVDEKEFVKQQGVLLQKGLGAYVPPYKTFPSGKKPSFGTKADEVAGKTAIKYDLVKLFFVPDAAVFEWAKKTFRTGEIRKGKKVIGAGIIHSIGGMKAFHNANRKPRSGRTKSLKGFQQMWVSEEMFAIYEFMVQRDVGIAKASVAKGFLMLNGNTRGINKFILKQLPKAIGSGKIVKLRGFWTAVFTAKAYGLQHLSQKTINIVMAKRMKAMETRLKHIFKDAAKKSGFKVR
tara:strand:+ start:125 stop:898 length:774 start_codon:yes stop_codon:yes gene_type:complete